MICFWKSTGEHFHYFILLLILFIDSAPLKSTFCNQRPMCIIIQIICWLYNTNKTDFTSYYDIWCDSCQYVDKCCHLSTYWQPMMTVDIWLSNPDIDLSLIKRTDQWIGQTGQKYLLVITTVRICDRISRTENSLNSV